MASSGSNCSRDSMQGAVEVRLQIAKFVLIPKHKGLPPCLMATRGAVEKLPHERQPPAADISALAVHVREDVMRGTCFILKNPSEPDPGPDTVEVASQLFFTDPIAVMAVHSRHMNTEFPAPPRPGPGFDNAVTSTGRAFLGFVVPRAAPRHPRPVYEGDTLLLPCGKKVQLTAYDISRATAAGLDYNEEQEGFGGRNVCWACHKKETADFKLKKCGGCGTARYCGKECIAADWKKHKKSCRRTDKARSSSAE